MIEYFIPYGERIDEMPKFLIAARHVFEREHNELLSMLARILQANENFKSKFLKH